MTVPDRRTLIVATLILLLAAFLRLHRLSDFPPGVAYDEAENLSDAVRVSLVGWFPAYNDTRPEPLNRYLQGALMLAGGRTIFTGRLTMALIGILAVAFTFRAAMSLLLPHPDRRVSALMAQAVLAVLVNAVVLSRWGERGILLVLVMGVALYFMGQAWHRCHTGQAALAGFFTGGVVHTYTAGLFFPVVVPLLLLHQLVFDLKGLRRRLGPFGAFLLGAMAPFIWWLWQMAQPGVLYRRGQDVNYWPEGDYVYLVSRLPERMLRASQGFYRFGDCDPQFNVWSKPLLNPLLFALMLLGVAICLRHIRRFETGLLLSSVVAMLLPVALSEDSVHGMRIAGEFLPAAILIGIGTGWALQRVSWLWAARGRAIGIAVTACLVAGTAANSLHSYMSYLGYRFDGDLWCVGSPMDPDFYFLTERVAFARAVIALEGPVYIPVDVANAPEIRVVLAQRYPHVRSVFAESGQALNLPDGDVVAWTPVARSNYAVLIPGSRPGTGQTLLLPPLPPEARDALRDRLQASGSRLEGLSRGQRGVRLAVSGAANPFARLIAPRVAPIATYSNGMQLAGYEAPFILTPGRPLDITLLWQKGPGLRRDDFTGVTLIDSGGRSFGSSYGWLLRWLYAPAMWRPGEVIPDTHRIDLPDDMPPGAYRLRPVVSIDREASVALPATGPDGGELGEFFPIGFLKVPLPDPGAMPPDFVPLDIRVGGVRLRGFRAEQGGVPVALVAAAPSSELTLAFYWEVPERLQATYHIFIQIQEEAAGEVLAGFDGPPAGVEYPTIVWGPDERLITRHSITLPTVEAFEVRVGLYDYPSLVRAPVIQNGRRVDDDRAILWP